MIKKFLQFRLVFQQLINHAIRIGKSCRKNTDKSHCTVPYLRKDQNDQQYHNRHSKNNRNRNRQKFHSLFLLLCRIRKPFQKAFIHPVAHRCKDISDQCAVQERFQNVEYYPDTRRNICTLIQNIQDCKSKCQNGSACDTKFHVFCVFIMFQ